eukprot:4161801-Lingulodinium_polyedra.AAC.1
MALAVRPRGSKPPRVIGMQVYQAEPPLAAKISPLQAEGLHAQVVAMVFHRHVMELEGHCSGLPGKPAELTRS